MPQQQRKPALAVRDGSPLRFFGRQPVHLHIHFIKARMRDRYANGLEIKLNIPLAIALVVSIAGTVSLLLVDHGTWNRPIVESPDVVQYSDTAAAAKAIGATVTPTAPRPAIEPEAPGPKPVQPAAPK